jgi:hypothetical protein
LPSLRWARSAEVPAGALASPLTLSIQTITNEAPGGTGVAYRLGPEATTFTTPVKLTFTPTAADLAGSEAPALAIAYQDSALRWNALKSITRDDAAKTLSVQTAHFSDWSVVQGWQLKPGALLLKGGETRQFVVNICDTDPDGDALASLIYQCSPDAEFFTVNQWTVNSIVNGDAVVGMLADTDVTSATYTAPATAPPQGNPIAVSASMTRRTTGQKTLLSSLVFIDTHPPLSGKITSTQKTTSLGRTITTEAIVGFKFDPPNQVYRVAPGLNMVAVSYHVLADGCEAQLTGTADVSPADGQILLSDSNYFPSFTTPTTLVGTSSCNPTRTMQPMTLTYDVEWWPAPADRLVLIKDNGAMNESFTDFDNGDGVSSSEWALDPVPTP